MGWFLTPQVWMTVWPLIEAHAITVCEPLAECCNLQTLEMFVFFFFEDFFSLFCSCVYYLQSRKPPEDPQLACIVTSRCVIPRKLLFTPVNVLASCWNSFRCVGHFLVFIRWRVKLHVILHWQNQILQSRGQFMFDNRNISFSFLSGWYVKAEKSDPEEVK